MIVVLFTMNMRSRKPAIVVLLSTVRILADDDHGPFEDNTNESFVALDSLDSPEPRNTQVG